MPLFLLVSNYLLCKCFTNEVHWSVLLVGFSMEYLATRKMETVPGKVHDKGVLFPEVI